MTLIKSKKSGQSVFEYFILTVVVVSLLMLFTKSNFFKSVKQSSETAFQGAAGELTK